MSGDLGFVLEPDPTQSQTPDEGGNRHGDQCATDDTTPGESQASSLAHLAVRRRDRQSGLATISSALIKPYQQQSERHGNDNIDGQIGEAPQQSDSTQHRHQKGQITREPRQQQPTRKTDGPRHDRG